MCPRETWAHENLHNHGYRGIVSNGEHWNNKLRNEKTNLSLVEYYVAAKMDALGYIYLYS